MRRRLQKTRLLLCGAWVGAALGCADPLVGRLLDDSHEPERPYQRPPATWSRYVVQPGDTLGRIATCRRVSVAALARANRISAPDHLPAGAVLRVPRADACAAGSPLEARVPAPLHAEAEGTLAMATSAYDGADFEQALAIAEQGIEALAPHRDGAANALRADLHVVAGMAAAGLEQRGRAIEEFRRALALAPHLVLDPQRSSPRVLELVDAARASPSADGRFVESPTD